MVIPVERAGSGDLMQLAVDVGSTPGQVGVVLVLEGPVSDVATVLGERVGAVPRLRQRLLLTPFGAGRAIWVDDPGFDVTRHVRTVACPASGDERSLLAVAADALTTPLPRSRSMWAATLVTGLAGGRAALVIVFHHVLTDGIGGLAVLGLLVDGAPAPHTGAFPRPAPTRAALTRDALRGRLRAVSRLPAGLRGALAQLRPADHVRAPRTSLNRPTGPHRGIAVVRADLSVLREVAHGRGATVNDLLLDAVTGALRSVASARGEELPVIVVSVPIAARTATTAAQLGNEVGVMVVALPTTGDRLARIAAITRVHRTRARGASAPLVAIGLRAVAALGLLRWFLDHQRQVTTFVTDLRGPSRPLSFGGARVDELIPLTTASGNVTVVFAALSYAGALVLTVVADPDRCPDLPELAAALTAELGGLGRCPSGAELERPAPCAGPSADGPGRPDRSASDADGVGRRSFSVWRPRRRRPRPGGSARSRTGCPPLWSWSWSRRPA